jgi:hypothetical protein
MIPTMIVFGLLTGRWWKTSLVLGAVGWAAVVFFIGVITASQIPAAALFGLVNTGVGVAIHQGVLWLVRRLRGSSSSTGEQVPTLVA